MQPEAETASARMRASRKIEAAEALPGLTILVTKQGSRDSNSLPTKDLASDGKLAARLLSLNGEQRNLNLLLSPPGRPHPDPGLFFARAVPTGTLSRKPKAVSGKQ